MYRIHLPRDELHERLGGGIPEGALCVVEGEYGAGKSILFQRLIYGLLKNGVAVSLVSTELTTYQFIEQMHSLDYPVEEAILERRLLFLPVYPVLGYRGDRHHVLEKLIRARRMYTYPVIAIDTFSQILKTHARFSPSTTDLHGKVEEALYRFKILNARGKTILLALEPKDVDEEVSSMLKAAADVYLQIRLEVVGTSVSRSILVRRFTRAERAVADIIPFRVEPKVGLVVEIKSVS